MANTAEAKGLNILYLFSDDDDMSWKVRRASAKCLASILGSRHELLSYFYTTVSPKLIARFKGEN